MLLTTIMWLCCLGIAQAQNSELRTGGFQMPSTSFQNQGGYLFAQSQLRGITSRMSKMPGEIEGSPYLKEEFTSAVVCTRKVRAAGVKIRYNMYDDQMEVLQAGGIYSLEPKEIQKIEFDNHVYVVKTLKVNGTIKTGYVEVLDSGKVSLFLKSVVRFNEKKEADPLVYKNTPANFSRVPDVLYYQVNSSEPTKIKSANKMINEFPDKKNELKEYIKKEQITMKTEDIVKLVKFYNSL